MIGNLNKGNDSGKLDEETIFPHIVIVRLGVGHCLICDVDIPNNLRCFERHTSGVKHQQKLKQQKLNKNIENNNNFPQISHQPQTIPEINKPESYCQKCLLKLPITNECFHKEEISNYENEPLENKKKFPIKSSKSGVKKSKLKNEPILTNSSINTSLNQISPKTENLDAIYNKDVHIPTKTFIYCTEEQSKMTKPATNLHDFVLSENIETTIKYSKEDLLIFEKIKSRIPNEKDILQLKEFVNAVENAIIDLKNQLFYSQDLFDTYKLKKSLFKNEKFDNLISDCYRLDVLGTELFMSTDMEFQIAILLNPIVKPTKFVFSNIYNSLVSIIKEKYFSLVSSYQTQFIFCLLSNSEKKYKIEIVLASTTWSVFQYIYQVCYMQYNSNSNKRIMDSIKLCEWFKSCSHDSQVIKILCILVRDMPFSKNPLNRLSFWASVILAIHALNCSPHLCGVSRNLRRMFSILSSGILLSDGEGINHPPLLSKILKQDLTHEATLDITEFSQCSLKSISTGNLTNILNY